MAVTNLGSLGSIDWSDWIRGLLSATISGGSGAVSAGVGTMVVDPKDFNIYTGKIYLVMLATFTFSASVALFNYLKVKPIPEYKRTTTTEERSEHSSMVTGTGDGNTIEKRSPHSTVVKTVVEEIPVTKETATILPPTPPKEGG